MVDISKVQTWVQKAVADIAAFDDNTKKVSDAEKKALGYILAGEGLTQDDKDYIEGFMLDKSGSAEVSEPRTQRNEARMVERPLYFREEAVSEEIKAIQDKIKMFFDEGGNPVRSETIGKDGEVTGFTNIKWIGEDVSEYEGENKIDNDTVLISHQIQKGNSRENFEILAGDLVFKCNNEVASEAHFDKNKGISTTTFYPNNHVCHNLQREEMEKAGRITHTITESFAGGVAEMIVKDADGNVISTIKGTYSEFKDEYGGYLKEVSYPEDMLESTLKMMLVK